MIARTQAGHRIVALLLAALMAVSSVTGHAASGSEDVSYYILLLSGANSHIMIRRYDRGSYADLRRNLEQQSYFALGYYQMGAKLNKEKLERIAAANEKTEAAHQ